MDKRIIAGGAVAAVLLLGGGAYWMAHQKAPAAEAPKGETPTAEAEVCVPKAVTVSADDYVLGKAYAPITIIEYFSQTCSHCAEFRKLTVPKLEEAYIKTGVVKLVLRDFQRNQADLAASVIARCMGRASFIPFADLLLEEQETWLGREDQDPRAGLKDMAKRSGMSGDDFEACLKKEDEAKKLLAARERTLKETCLSGTPTLFMNGRKLEKAMEFDVLDGLIKDEMKALSITMPKSEAAKPAAETKPK